MYSTIYTCYPRHMCIPTRYTLPTRYNVSHYIFDVPTTYLLCPQYIHVTNHIKDVLLTVYTDFSTIYICHPTLHVTHKIYILPTRYIHISCGYMFPTTYYILWRTSYMFSTTYPFCNPQDIPTRYTGVYIVGTYCGEHFYILWVTYLVGNVVYLVGDMRVC